MRSEDLVYVCVSVQGYSVTTGHGAAYERYQRLQKGVKPTHLLTTLIQLGGHTYLLYAFNSLKLLPLKVRMLSLLFSFLAFTVHSYSLIAHAHALTWYTCNNPIHAAPAQCKKHNYYRDLISVGSHCT